MISITRIFETGIRQSAREAGRSIASGAGLGVRGAGQLLTGTGHSVARGGQQMHDRFAGGQTKQRKKT